MAAKVQPVDIVLNVKGTEKFSALNRSFRDLSKQARLSDKDIVQATKDVIAFAEEAGNSEATIRGQIKAFEGLREQASAGGKVYLELGNQIKQLKSDLRGSTDASEEQRAALVKAGQAAKGSAADIKSVVSELERLQKSARPGSSAFAQLSKDIAVLKSQLKEANVEVKKFNAGFEISQRPAMSLEKIQRQIGRLTEGLKGLNFVSNDFLNVQQRIQLLGQVQSSTIGRQQVIAREQMFSSAAFETFAAGPAGSLQLPKTAAALNLEIGELQERLANTVPGETYNRLSNEIASKQVDLQQVLLGTADAYDKVAAAQDRSTRVAQKIADLQEYQRSSGDLAPGVGGYRDPETGAMIARGRGQIADRAAYRKRGEAFVEGVVSESERLGAIPALPMAGTTTAPGTGADISGMARRFTGQVEVTRAPAIATSIYPGLRDRAERLPSAQVGVQPAGGFGEQVIRRQISALREAAGAYRPYNDAIRKARAANNGSINSINNLKNALIAKRNEIPATSAAFRRLSKEIQDLDDKSERASRRMNRRRMSAMQMTQAAGAVLSGGIFGGPEGFVGGAAGALVGGVGGAFAGAAIGAQVGGIRRTLGEYADYAAQITRLNIALQGITEVQDDAAASQVNYTKALAAAADVTAQLNVPQEVAIQGMTRLVAAVKGAGGGVAEAEVAFKNINSAIIATGGGAEQVQGAVTALVQIFSKGKVSAEEINQIAERLPGTFNKIAAASGRTGPQLTKALQKGQVGLNDLMKFLVSLGDEYGELAKKIAGSSENAGARLQVAFNQMRIEVGNALQPIGAEFQNIFREFIIEITPALVEILPKIGEAFLAVAKNIDTVVVAMAAALGVFAVGKIAAIVTSIGSLSAALFTLKLNATLTTKALIGLNGAALINPYTALAAGVAALATNLYTAAKRQRELNNLIRQGSVADVEAKIKELQSEQAEIEQRSIAPKSAAQKALELAGRAATSTLFVDPDEGDRRRLAEIRRLLPQLKERLRVAKYDAEQGAAADLAAGDLFNFPDPVLDEDGNGKKARTSKLDAIRDSGKLLGIEKQILDNAREITQAQADANFDRVNQLNNQKISLEFARRSAENEFEYAEAVRQAANDENKNALIAEAALEKEIKDKLLLIQYESALADEAQRSALAAKERQKALDDEIFGLRDQLGLVTDDQRIARFRAQAIEKYGEDDPRVGEAVDLFRQQIDPTFLEGIQQAVRSIGDELEELVDPINQVTGAAAAIGDAFSKSFLDTITGASTAREALASFFRNVGNYFLDLAGNIIAKLIEIAVLESLTSVFGGGSAGGSGILSRIFGFKDGGVVRGIEPFAKGGIVDKPTLFKYADGGSGRFGLMGEAGSEAIMPLRRGRNGRLGVEATGVSMGDINVNVDASGSSVQGDETKSSQLGKAIGVVVQQELIKQRRPGGLLHSSV